MLEKCCKTCEHLFNHNSPKYSCEIHDYENGFHKEWDITKDFCSKWRNQEEDEKILKLAIELFNTKYDPDLDAQLYDWYLPESRKYHKFWIELVKDFQKRIRESLKEAEQNATNTQSPLPVFSKYEKAFDWIL